MQTSQFFRYGRVLFVIQSNASQSDVKAKNIWFFDWVDKLDNLCTSYQENEQGTGENLVSEKGVF